MGGKHRGVCLFIEMAKFDVLNVFCIKQNLVVHRLQISGTEWNAFLSEVNVCYKVLAAKHLIQQDSASNVTFSSLICTNTLPVSVSRSRATIEPVAQVG